MTKWLSLDDDSEFHKNLEEVTTVKDDNIFQSPLLMTDHYHYNYDHRNYDRFKFRYANDKGCTCDYSYNDSLVEVTDEYKNKKNIIENEKLCSTEMDDEECYYMLRKSDRFDIAIENAARDGCTDCYSVDKDLWLLTKDKLMERIKPNTDCEPIDGYHRSRRNEIYRCESDSTSNGVQAFTEANGSTFTCGIHRDYRPETWGWFRTSYEPITKVGNYHVIRLNLRIITS